MCNFYRLHRELRFSGLFEEEPPVPWPETYDPDIVEEAMQFAVIEAERRSQNQTELSYEVDGIEIIGEDVIDEPDEAFEIVKDERDFDINFAIVS